MSVLEQTAPEGYKQTEVGIIPDDWDCLSLQDLCTQITDGTHHTPKYVDSGIPFYSVENITKNNFTDTKYITEQEHKSLIKRCKPEHGDIIMSRITAGILGDTKLIDWDVDASIYVSLALLKFKGNYSAEYIYNYTKSNQFLNNISQSGLTYATPKKINLNAIGSVYLPIPKELEEQKTIASALSDVDTLLTELEKLIAKKQAIKTATMQQLLTGKTRLPQFATYTEGEKQGQPKGTKSSELGEIPEDWDVRPIESVIRDLRGGAPFKPNDFTNAGVKVLPKGGVVRGGVLRVHEKDQQFCSKNWSLKYAKNCVDNRYTIVVLRDLVPSGPSIGLMVNIPTDEKYVLAQGVYGFIADDEETSNYLIQYSNTTQYRKAANEIMVGSTQVHITNGAFKALIAPFPPKEERGAIATILTDMDNEIQTLEQRLAKTRQIKQGMMQDLLTGRTRLPFDREAQQGN